MPDIFEAIEVNPADSLSIKKHLEAIRLAQAEDGDLLSAVNAAIKEFNQYFLHYGEPRFSNNKLRRNETPTSEIYNENLETLSDDIEQLYAMLESLADTTIGAFNYAAVVAEEISQEAQIAASRVLDLNIISNFVKGTTIVAGDDFVDSKKIDFTIGVDTTQAVVLGGANAISLEVQISENVSSPDTIITITPVMPAGDSDKVNTDPTPQNLERFYEGSYYEVVGQQRPAGGQLKMKYIVDPADIPPGTVSKTFADGSLVGQVGDSAEILAANKLLAGDGGIGFYAIVPPTAEELAAMRARMIDGNPSTFWECEFVFGTPSLIDPYAGEGEG